MLACLNQERDETARELKANLAKDQQIFELDQSILKIQKENHFLKTKSCVSNSFFLLQSCQQNSACVLKKLCRSLHHTISFLNKNLTSQVHQNKDLENFDSKASLGYPIL